VLGKERIEPCHILIEPGQTSKRALACEILPDARNLRSGEIIIFWVADNEFAKIDASRDRFVIPIDQWRRDPIEIAKMEPAPRRRGARQGGVCKRLKLQLLQALVCRGCAQPAEALGPLLS